VIGTPSLRLGVPTFAGTKLTFPLRFSAVLRGRTAMLTVTPLTVRCHGHACPAVPGRPVSRAIVLRAKTLRFPLPAPGTGIALALDTAAFQLADAPWAAASASARFVRR
jgi:hypothetical protein